MSASDPAFGEGPDTLSNLRVGANPSQGPFWAVEGARWTEPGNVTGDRPGAEAHSLFVYCIHFYGADPDAAHAPSVVKIFSDLDRASLDREIRTTLSVPNPYRSVSLSTPDCTPAAVEENRGGDPTELIGRLSDCLPE